MRILSHITGKKYEEHVFEIKIAQQNTISFPGFPSSDEIQTKEIQ